MFGAIAIAIGEGITINNNQHLTGTIPAVDSLLLEDGFNYLQEDGISLFLLE